MKIPLKFIEIQKVFFIILYSLKQFKLYFFIRTNDYRKEI
jgi:hypothetical protein